MSRRRVFVLGAVVTAAMLALGFYVPGLFPSSAQKLVEELRSCLEPTDGAAKADPSDAEETHIRIAIVVAEVDTDRPGASIFERGEKEHVSSAALARNGSAALAILQKLTTSGHANLLAAPTVTTFSGQFASVSSGGEVPIGFDDAGKIIYKPYGNIHHVKATLCKDGRIHLDLNVELSELLAPINLGADGIAINPQFDIVAAKASLLLRDGQTGCIGVPTKKIRKEIRRLPLLGELPAVGDWFTWTCESDRDQEVLILITPTLVTPLK